MLLDVGKAIPPQRSGRAARPKGLRAVARLFPSAGSDIQEGVLVADIDPEAGASRTVLIGIYAAIPNGRGGHRHDPIRTGIRTSGMSVAGISPAASRLPPSVSSDDALLQGNLVGSNHSPLSFAVEGCIGQSDILRNWSANNVVRRCTSGGLAISVASATLVRRWKSHRQWALS